jgi:plastocyanin
MRPTKHIFRGALTVVVVLAALAFASGCSSSGSTSSSLTTSTSTSTTAARPSSAHELHIEIANFAFSPPSVTVKVGTIVTFTNKDSTEHTATSDSEGVFDTGTLAQGQSMKVVMNKVGTFTYHCSFHAFMHGSIKVVQ